MPHLVKPATSEIVAKLWNLCNVLRDDGVTYHQYVNELTYLLFLKMMQETKEEAFFVVKPFIMAAYEGRGAVGQ